MYKATGPRFRELQYTSILRCSAAQAAGTELSEPNCVSELCRPDLLFKGFAMDDFVFRYQLGRIVENHVLTNFDKKNLVLMKHSNSEIFVRNLPSFPHLVRLIPEPHDCQVQPRPDPRRLVRGLRHRPFQLHVRPDCTGMVKNVGPRLRDSAC